MSSLRYIWACCRVEEEEDGTRSRAKILDYEAIGDDMDKFNEELERQESRIKFRVEVGGIEGMEECVEWSDMCEFIEEQCQEEDGQTWRFRKIIGHKPGMERVRS